MAGMRIDPPVIAGEREMLVSWLEWHRATLALKCAGLDREQLVLRSVAPSNMSLLGLVRHMADVERIWFRRVLAGEDAPGIWWTEEQPDGEWENVDPADPEEAFASWHAECDFARRAVEEAPSLDVTGVRHGRDVSLRWILVHMIEEYARHNGHADLLRERIDGSVGE
ncbi:DinB family protein [Rhizohabitans arisaemae]|uniref:DinB family protein n=1 Tax=Rhizohabitans arisaemae TaxID=2720610 RepID=UPI0024B21A0F|nr:DinB family protein [Rhizohabitans arisaemae]